MDFQDRSQSVSSLLALLRSAQDGDENEGGVGAGASGGRGPGPSSAAASSGPNPTNPSPTRPQTNHPFQPQPQPPSNAQLSALLAQLGPSLPPPQPSSSSASIQTGVRRTSAFEGPSHNLLDPFGPVGQSPGGRGDGGRGDSAEGRRVSASADAGGSVDKGNKDKGKGNGKADETEVDRGEWSFTRCLPVLTELLRDDEFVNEVRKMKKDQDALERRLWARMEKIKAEQTAKQAADRQIAKITRKPVPAEKVAQWDRALKAALSDLFVRQVLPSLDGLEARQSARLIELGVPGLGGTREARKVRVRRIMGVLEGALD